MSFRRYMKEAVLKTADMLHLPDLFQHRMMRGLTILTYHRVLPDELARVYPLPALAMPLSAFHEQVGWLASQCDVYTVHDALKAARSRHDHDRPLLSITFDDGYLDNIEFAAPVLEQAGLKGTFFVTAGLVGSEQMLWFDRAALLWQHVTSEELKSTAAVAGITAMVHPNSLDQWIEWLKGIAPDQRKWILDQFAPIAPMDNSIRDYRLMTLDQVRLLHARGHEIASHSMSHPLMPQLTDEQLHKELLMSRELIRGWCACDVDGFCYPNGDHDDRIVAAALEAGYEYACTTRPGINRLRDNPMQLKRIHMNPCRLLNNAKQNDLCSLRVELVLRQGR